MSTQHAKACATTATRDLVGTEAVACSERRHGLSYFSGVERNVDMNRGSCKRVEHRAELNVPLLDSRGSVKKECRHECRHSTLKRRHIGTRAPLRALQLAGSGLATRY